MRYLILTILLSITVSASAQAQAARLTPAPSPLFALAHKTASQDTTRPLPPPTYWKEGAIAGGVTIGLFGAILSSGFCSAMDEGQGGCDYSLLGGFLLGGVLGGTIGALIGGQFPK